MKLVPTPLPGAFVIELELHRDERGAFARTFCRHELAAHGLNTDVAQCSLSRNTRRGTLRGLHYQAGEHGETKLVRCTRGAIFDVIVDLRPRSETERRWFGIELSAELGTAIYVPEGFAHGFITLADDTDVAYQMSRDHEPSAARGVRWDDPELAIVWPLPPGVISERDRTYDSLDRRPAHG